MLDGFLQFNSSERRAILTIALIAAVSLIALFVIDGIEGRESKEEAQTVEKRGDGNSQSKVVVVKQEFDPNTVDSATLAAFGISPKKVQNLLNYRQNGGHFKHSEDLRKLYTWTDEEFRLIEGYCKVEKMEKAGRKHETSAARKDDTYTSKRTAQTEMDTTKRMSERHFPEKFTSPTKVDVNIADTTILKKIPGIGSVISARIIRYRERLGGFTQMSQLLECSGVTEEMLEWMNVEEKNGQTRRININKATFAQIISHPYIDKNQTRDIISYRRIYGNIKSIEQLKSTNIFSEEELEKLSPYIEF